VAITEKRLRELVPQYSTKEAAEILDITPKHLIQLCRKYWIDLKPKTKVPEED